MKSIFSCLIFSLSIIGSLNLSAQKDIAPSIDIMLYLGRTPGKAESKTLYDNLLRMLYYEKKPEGFKKISFVNNKGEYITSEKFNMASDFYGDYANIIKDSVYGYIDKKGKQTLFKNYDFVFFYYGDIGIANKGRKEGLIDRKGNIIRDFDNVSYNFFGYNHFILTKNRKSQIINKKGDVVFSNNLNYYIKSYSFPPDSLIVYQKKINDKKMNGLINLKNELISNKLYEQVSYVGDEEHGYYAVKNNNKWGYINKRGEEVIPLIYDKISFNINEGLIPVQKDGKWGYIDGDNNIKIPFEYDEASAFTNKLAYVKKGEFYGCISMKNKVKIDFKLENSGYPFFTEKLSVFRKNNKYGFINKKGKVIIPPKFDKVYPFVDGLAYVKIGKKVGYINKKGEFIVPLKERQMWFPSDGIIRIAE
jgi:hypothetical protein